MSKTTRLLSGAMFGALLVSVAATAASAQETWKLSCDGNTCCAVSSSGKIGDCFEKVAAPSTQSVA